MTSQYYSLFTMQGLELLREAIQNGTKLGITHMSFGDGRGELPVPDALFTEMVNEVYRTRLNRLAPSKDNANWLDADAVIPTAVGGFNIREVGLWAGNVMVAYANYPPTYKPSADQGTAQIKTIRIVLQIDNTANFELKIDDSVVMATVQYVEDKYKKTIATVESIDDLFAIQNPENLKIVNVLSYHKDKNMGGGLFRYDSSKADINDSGTIINGWVRSDYEYITPEMFGTIGDGVTDDTDSFLAFAALDYPAKVATKSYFLTRTAIFSVTKNSEIDLSKSIIIGSDFEYTAIQIVINDVSLQNLVIKSGSYNGQNVVNGYMEVVSYGTAFVDYVYLECFGVAENFSNTKNNRSCFGYRVNVYSRVIKCKKPVVKNVNRINGQESVSGAQGVVINNFTDQGIVEDFDIQGIYSTNGLDADGISIFEKKNDLTTGKGEAIVRNGKIKQTAGRGVKSQCNLIVRDLYISLSTIEKGIISHSWRGVDAQLGNLDSKDVKFFLNGDIFEVSGDHVLFVANGSNDGEGNQFIKNVMVDGISNIRYVFLLNSKNLKNIIIDNFSLLEPQPNLNLLYVKDEIQVKENIIIKNISDGWNYNSRLIFDTYLNKRVKNLTLEKIKWTGYKYLNVSMFDKICIIDTMDINILGTLNYNSVDVSSYFTYLTDNTPTGGLSYTNPDVPDWAKRYIHYDRGVVYSHGKDNILEYFNNKFYVSTQQKTELS